MVKSSRMRWSYVNRDKDLDKNSELKTYERQNSKHKTKSKGTKTRDKVDSDTKETLRDKDLKSE